MIIGGKLVHPVVVKIVGVKKGETRLKHINKGKPFVADPGLYQRLKMFHVCRKPSGDKCGAG